MARAGLNREVVLARALALADAHGLAALTMRKLAGELDVEAMSLYNHVSNKQDLLRGLVDQVWGQVDLAADESDWRAALHRLAGSAYHAMLAHPWFMSLPVTFGGMARLGVIDATLGHMRRAGISADAAYHAQHVLDGYVAGYAWQAIGYLEADDAVERGIEMVRSLEPGRFPHLMEHVQQHMEDAPPGDGFVVGLDLLLDGLEAERGA